MVEKDETLSTAKLVISVKADQIAGVFQLLQRGVILRGEVGCSVRSFLYRQLQLTPEFIENQIKTIFLDGKPVDDLDSARVKDGCTLALSAAMPGLVGAIMRRGGYYASLRSQISEGAEVETPSESEGSVTLKLFNLLTGHQGKTLLENGVFVKIEDLEDLLSRQSGPGLQGVELTRDGMPLDWDAFRASIRADKLVHVRLKVL